jgi:hypothetical protein
LPVASSQLLATGYWLLVTGYWLLATGYWLLATGYWLPATQKSNLADIWMIRDATLTVFKRPNVVLLMSMSRPF